MFEIWALSLAHNIASERQTSALALALKNLLPVPDKVAFTHIFPLPPHHAAITSNTETTWKELLTPEQLGGVQCIGNDRVAPPWPDIIVSCRPEIAAIALSVKKASDGRSKIIHIQNPNSANHAYGFALMDFDLIVRQPQETIPAPNVISSRLALHGLNSTILKQFCTAQDQVFKPLKRPLITIMVGGSDEHITLCDESFKNFGCDLVNLAQKHDGTMAIVTSRRTTSVQREILESCLRGNPRILFDDQRFSYNALLAMSDAFIVTGDSLSMVSEAMATDKPRILYDFGGALSQHPLHPVFMKFAANRQITYFPDGVGDFSKHKPYDELPRLSRAIFRRLGLQEKSF